jgi:hypothetical protein
MLCSLSNLNNQDLEQIQSLEAELGKPLLAFSCHRTAPAMLAKTELDKIQNLEKKLNISLVAVDG